MRAEDFNIDTLMDYAEINRLDLHAVLASRYGMTYEDLSNEEQNELSEYFGSCDECGTPMRYSDLTFNDYLRGYVCYDCDMENQYDEDIDELEEELKDDES